ncbi:Casein kinase I isoform alpha-like 2 [Homarus americanus]|uniref:Casein kinase I isoform alpha-like 2 n=1 Tax=Homarus americanus TaxID=6706 RepID=A0A8J5JR34_HOMAM|nr:Casein kinase I isoform alpha-like 2 [Homarus americanus]
MEKIDTWGDTACDDSTWDDWDVPVHCPVSQVPSFLPAQDDNAHNPDTSSALSHTLEPEPLPLLSWDHLECGDKIGSGQCGVTHLGMLTLDDGRTTEVVVKMLHGGSPLTAEARTLQEVAGAGGAPLLHGVATNPNALVMQYCPGVTLQAMLEEYDLQQCYDAYKATVEAVNCFHTAGFYHQDLHPGNIIINTSVLPYTSHLLDLGYTRRFTGQLVRDDNAKSEDLFCLKQIKDQIDAKHY